MKMLLIGAPGSGKGTQGQRVGDELRLPHIATGDLIRAHIAEGTDFGKKVQAQIAAGNFVSDEDIAYWISKRLEEPDAADGYILDGYPRDIDQAAAFDAASSTDRAFDLVIEMVVPEEIVMERLVGRLVCPTCDRSYHERFNPPRTPGVCDHDGTALIRRPDDQPSAVRHRLDVYEELTLPLRAYYDKQAVLREIDATGSPDIVYERLAPVARPFASGHKNARLRV